MKFVRNSREFTVLNRLQACRVFASLVWAAVWAWWMLLGRDLHLMMRNEAGGKISPPQIRGKEAKIWRFPPKTSKFASFHVNIHAPFKRPLIPRSRGVHTAPHTTTSHPTTPHHAAPHPTAPHPTCRGTTAPNTKAQLAKAPRPAAQDTRGPSFTAPRPTTAHPTAAHTTAAHTTTAYTITSHTAPLYTTSPHAQPYTPQLDGPRAHTPQRTHQSLTLPPLFQVSFLTATINIGTLIFNL